MKKWDLILNHENSEHVLYNVYYTSDDEATDSDSSKAVCFVRVEKMVYTRGKLFVARVIGNDSDWFDIFFCR